MRDTRKHWVALGVAGLAGLVAATVTYLFYARPAWRRHALTVGRHLFSVAEGMVKHRADTRDIEQR